MTTIRTILLSAEMTTDDDGRTTDERRAMKRRDGRTTTADARRSKRPMDYSHTNLMGSLKQGVL